MKKVYLSLLSLGIFSAVIAQEKSTMKENSDLYLGNMSARNSKQVSAVNKALGDVIWSNTMSNTTNWAASVIGGTQGADLGFQFSPTNTGGTSIGSWAFTSTKINSTTKTTGYFIAKNGNPSTNSPAPVANVELVLMYDSIFNLSTYPAVDFKFQEFGAAFIENQVVEASVDNGTTWVEIGNNSDLGQLTASGGSNFPNPSNRSYHVNAAFPQGTDFSAVKFRFRLYWPTNAGANSGIMYGWFVDDVQLVEAASDDLVIDEIYNFVGTAGLQYSQIPSSQVTNATTAIFSAKVKNVGPNDQSTTLTVTNTGAVGASAESTVVGFSNDSLFTTTPYQVPSVIGVYNYLYNVTSSNNTLSNTTDDSKTAKFQVTDKIMATDTYDGTAGTTNGSFGGWSSMAGDQEIGTIFEIFNNATVGAVIVGIASVGTPATYVGREIVAKLYEFDGTTGAVLLIDQTMIHTTVTADFGHTIKLNFYSQIPVEAGKLYIVTASSGEGAEVPVTFAGYVNVGNTVGIDNSDVSVFSLAGATANLVEAPVVRLDFTDYTGLKEIDNALNLNVYPNPFNESTVVSYEVANASTCSINVTDVTGRVVYEVPATVKNAGNHTIEINGSSLNGGIYSVNINVNGVVSSTRIIKK
ncbi:MAG: T9SS type A sorting domain-containing protein [Flavobacteriia bacterium]|nr:T9SS type A sorting domain-containing protein [Flavobacteriia bacterium]